MNIARLIVIFLALLLSTTDFALAWGARGHKVVGALALGQLSGDARQALYELLESQDVDTITDWCNWPDEYRGTDEGAWTFPLHFVNIDPSAEHYDRARDCPADMCVTEAIPRFAYELADQGLDPERRKQAFGYVCHFVGDLSQTLHAGFAHDRGGNDFQIRYQGQDTNLHSFWDSILIEERSDSWLQLATELEAQARATATDESWATGNAVTWTHQSHQLAESRAYPEESEISGEFADDSWEMIRSQLAVGGVNLADLLETVLAAPKCD